MERATQGRKKSAVNGEVEKGTLSAGHKQNESARAIVLWSLYLENTLKKVH